MAIRGIKLLDFWGGRVAPASIPILMGSGSFISGAPKVSEDFNVDLTPLAGLALQRLMSYAGGRRVLGPASLITLLMEDGSEIPRPITVLDVILTLYIVG